MTTSYPFVQIYLMYILKSIHIQCTIYNRHIHISYKHINTYIYTRNTRIYKNRHHYIYIDTLNYTYM